MFNKCNEIIYIDLSLFDTSQVTNMSYMFSECTNLESIILPNASAKNVTDMSYMFNKCSELKKIEFPRKIHYRKFGKYGLNAPFMSKFMRNKFSIHI